MASLKGPLPDEIITFGYDELGRRISTAINGVASSETYDAGGRTITSANSLKKTLTVRLHPMSTQAHDDEIWMSDATQHRRVFAVGARNSRQEAFREIARHSGE